MQKGTSRLAQFAQQAGIPVLKAGGPIGGTRVDLIVFDDMPSCPKCGALGADTLLMTNSDGDTSCFDCVAEQAYIKEGE